MMDWLISLVSAVAVVALVVWCAYVVIFYWHLS